MVVRWGEGVGGGERCVFLFLFWRCRRDDALAKSPLGAITFRATHKAWSRAGAEGGAGAGAGAESIARIDEKVDEK